MSAATCPSCHSDHCGNHAACARRNADRITAEIVRLAEWCALWEVIARVQKVLDATHTGVPMFDGMTLAMIEPQAREEFRALVQRHLRFAQSTIRGGR